jgi:hypothetical protein
MLVSTHNFCDTYFMKSTGKTVLQSRRGRPSTGYDPVTAIRLSAEIRSAIDAWSKRQVDTPGRSEAIRRLIELGLAVKVSGKKNATQRSRASDMAGSELDKQVDKTASAEDQATRKRRLLKGPQEFRDVRVDRKTKK